MSTNMPGFQSCSHLFASFCNGRLSHQQRKGLSLTHTIIVHTCTNKNNGRSALTHERLYKDFWNLNFFYCHFFCHIVAMLFLHLKNNSGLVLTLANFFHDYIVLGPSTKPNPNTNTRTLFFYFCKTHVFISYQHTK